MILETSLAIYKIDNRGYIYKILDKVSSVKKSVTKSNKLGSYNTPNDKLLEIYKEELILLNLFRKRIYRHRRKLRKLGLIDNVKTSRSKLLLSRQFKILRKQILIERGKICEECGSVGKYVHHIKSRKDYPKLILEKSNLIVLCLKCHRLKHRDMNERFFKE